jgi:hypothetical protein
MFMSVDVFAGENPALRWIKIRVKFTDVTMIARSKVHWR